MKIVNLSRGLRLFLGTPLMALGFMSSPLAITIQNANTPGYVTGNNAYSGVVQVNTGGGGICSGALVSSVTILTAGHCIDGAASWQVKFETASGTSVVGVADSLLHPNFGANPAAPQLDLFDVGLLTLSAAAPNDAPRYSLGLNLNLNDLINQNIDLVGYGLGGNPTVGFLNTGVRRHAQNQFIGTFLPPDFPDLPLEMQMTFGLGNPAGNGLINGGDSGGPAFFNGAIVGVASFGNLPRPGGGNYQNNVLYTTAHTNLLNPVIGDWVKTHIPEPGTCLLIALGISLLIGERHRRTGHAC
jgi:Trypsin